MKSENEDVIDTIQLNMELEKVKQYIDILDDREKEVIVGRFGLDLKKEKRSERLPKNSVSHAAMYRGLKNGR